VIGPDNAAKLYAIAWATPEEKAALQKAGHFEGDAAEGSS
jgi:hypothetical protein